MKQYFFIIESVAFWAFLLTFSVSYAQPPPPPPLPSGQGPLKDGKILKIEVKQSGIYKISAAELAAAGLNWSDIAPKNLQLFGNKAGMLPQKNTPSAPKGLQEIAFQIVGAPNNRLNANSYLLFYGESADNTFYDTKQKIWRTATNHYDVRNFYFLKAGKSAGKRITKQTASTTAKDTLRHFTDFFYHEQEQHNFLKSGRQWFGELFTDPTPQTFSIPTEGVLPQAPIRLLCAAASKAKQKSQMRFLLDGTPLGKLQFSALPAGTYSKKADYQTQTFDLSNPKATPSKTLSIRFEKENENGETAYLDFFSLNFRRVIKKYRPQQFLRFYSPSPQTKTFEVADISEKEVVWDVTDFQNPKQLRLNKQYFTTKDSGVYALFSPEDALKTVSIKKIPNQNLLAFTAPTLLIVTPKIFKAQAQRLANFKIEHENMRAAVVEVETIYKEFASGKKDITAIRNFIRTLYLKKTPALNYVLLFGDASFDYKNILKKGHNFIPVYESEESLHPIYSYSSDDYFGFMDADEGLWSEHGGGKTHDLELGIGRLPVSSAEEAKAVVDKLIRYSSSKAGLGSWRNRVVMVADDGDGNIYQKQTQQLGEHIELAYKHYNIRRLFVDAFRQETTPLGKKSFELKALLSQTVENGALIVNYIGHGAETGWASEGILDNPQIMSWQNRHKMPLFVTATCEFGRYDNPAKKSGAEYAVLHPGGGAIGLLSTTRPVFSNTNFLLNKAFYAAAFKKIGGKMPALGDIIRITKNNSISGVLNRNFSLLGDPSMRLAKPKADVVLTKIDEKIISERADTLKALQKVRLSGEIREHNRRATEFNGELEVVVFDKKTEAKTLGDGEENTVMTFKTQEKVLFRGRASVKNGAFSCTFVVPKTIDYKFGKGKISFYAKHKTELKDAHGFYDNILVGGSAAVLPDRSPPAVRACLGDWSFADGGLVPPNTVLLLEMSDAQGINLAGNGIDHQLTATLDGKKTFVLNDYFVGETDDFTKGVLRYPLKALSPGKHVLKISVWDTHNNQTLHTLNFVVTDSKDFTIADVFCYPSPASGSDLVFCTFAHNKAGTAVEVLFSVYNAEGKTLNTQTLHFEKSPSVISVPVWQNKATQAEHSRPGLYFFELEAKHKAGGKHIRRRGKFMIK